MKKFLHKISSITDKIERVLIVFGIAAIMINTTANAIGRYAFGHSIYFSEELNQFLIVAVTFIGFAYAVRKGRNIRMTALYDALSFSLQKKMTTVISLLTSLLMFFLAYLGLLYVQELHSINKISPSLQIHVFWIYAIIPLGFAAAGLQYAMCFVMNLLHKEIYISMEVIDGESEQGEGI